MPREAKPFTRPCQDSSRVGRSLLRGNTTAAWGGLLSSVLRPLFSDLRPPIS